MKTLLAMLAVAGALEARRVMLESERALELASAQADNQLCVQNRDRLLSKGRWICDYSAKVGACTYRFAAKTEQR